MAMPSITGERHSRNSRVALRSCFSRPEFKKMKFSSLACFVVLLAGKTYAYPTEDGNIPEADPEIPEVGADDDEDLSWYKPIAVILKPATEKELEDRLDPSTGTDDEFQFNPPSQPMTPSVSFQRQPFPPWGYRPLLPPWLPHFFQSNYYYDQPEANLFRSSHDDFNFPGNREDDQQGSWLSSLGLAAYRTEDLFGEKDPGQDVEFRGDDVEGGTRQQGGHQHGTNVVKLKPFSHKHSKQQWMQDFYGPAGAVGPIGPAGRDGTNGINGINGVDGKDGKDGDQGPAGPIGAQGQVGPPGTNGVNGPAGAQGSPGVPGIQGIQGIQGNTGPQGIQGEKGAAGINGLDGLNGLDGKDGIAGPPGPQGPIGVPGKHGKDGKDGPIGPIGPAGPAGILGTDGKDAIDGKDGSDGTVGAAGPPGPPGKDGKNGSPGQPGTDGQDGQDGTPGEPGPAGAASAAGSAGPAGPPGVPGAPGAPGAPGSG